MHFEQQGSVCGFVPMKKAKLSLPVQNNLCNIFCSSIIQANSPLSISVWLGDPRNRLQVIISATRILAGNANRGGEKRRFYLSMENTDYGSGNRWLADEIGSDGLLGTKTLVQLSKNTAVPGW